MEAGSGLGHIVAGPAAGVNAVAQTLAPAHGDETEVFANAGCPGGEGREDAQEI